MKDTNSTPEANRGQVVRGNSEDETLDLQTIWLLFTGDDDPKKLERMDERDVAAMR